jgi:plastocyanin
VESPQASSIPAGVHKLAARGSAQARGSAVLIGVGVLMVCLAIPATLVGAQAPAPPADPGAGQAVTPEEPTEPPAPEPPPPPTSTDPPEPSPAPPPPVPKPDDPPPPAPDASATVSAAGSASVSVGDNFFAPPSITIQVGGTVTWSNDGQTAHTTTANDGSFDSGNLDPGQSFNHTFTQPGTFAYYCEYHRSLGQEGTVTVQASGSGGGDGTSDSGTSSGTTTPTGPGSESGAVTSPGAAGSSTQLPSTGMPLVPLLAAGVGLLLAGALLRRRARVVS